MSVSGLLLPRLKTASGDAFIREPMMPLAMSVTNLHKTTGAGPGRSKRVVKTRDTSTLVCTTGVRKVTLQRGANFIGHKHWDGVTS